MDTTLPLFLCKYTWHGKGQLYLNLHVWNFFRLKIFNTNLYRYMLCTSNSDVVPAV